MIRSLKVNQMSTISESAIFVLLLMAVQGLYWDQLLRQLDRGHIEGESIRSHCGRNQYEGELFHYDHSAKKRIIGGSLARVAEWPWLVSLQLRGVNKLEKRSDNNNLALDHFGSTGQPSMEELAEMMAQIKLRLKEPSLAEHDDFLSTVLLPGLNQAAEPTEVPLLEGHTCGGALISPWWILTAKHCFQEKRNPSLSASNDRWIAILGEHNLNEVEQHEIKYEISKIIVYPDDENSDIIKPGTIQNDIALVKLKRPAKLDKYVQIGCLPYPDEEFRENQICSVAGWGVTEENGNISMVPQHISIPLVSHQRCQEIYSKWTTVTSRTQIEPSMLCAGGEGRKDACQFDSGGPLVCRSNEDKQWIITGIVSFGVGCASRYPGIYTRVTNYISWINDVVTNE